MPPKPLGIPRRIIFGYLFAITVLGAYAWYLREKKHHRIQADEDSVLLLNSLAGSSLSYYLELNQLNKIGDAFRRDDNTRRQEYARAINTAQEYLAESLTDALSQVAPFPIVPLAVNIYNRPMEHEALDIVAGLRVYPHTLLYYTKSDPGVKAICADYFSDSKVASAQTILSIGSTQQKALMLATLRIGVVLAAKKAYAVLRDKMYEPPPIQVDYLPVINVKNYCVKAGDMLEGEVSLLAYSANTANVSFFANGKQLPNQNGIGKLESVYQAAGNKDVAIEIRVKNPLTGNTDSYAKHFLIPACQ